ncbi:restriction endonuclease subunit S [Amylibacter sp.]|nr:restriction endonuclease subunit S [Amylibacter sp.]
MSSVVPEGWSKENLGSIFDKISNGTTANQIETTDGESVTRIETISDGYVNFEKVGKIHSVDADKRYLMERGDILFSNINSVKHIGKVAYFNGEKPLYHGMNLLLFRTNETYAHSKFIFNLMRSDDFRLEISKRVKPAINQASISGGDLKEINFLSPPLPEQKKIASILTSVDEVIETTQKQIDKLQDLKKATMNKLLTKGIGHTEFKDSELGRIPKSWEVNRLSLIAQVIDSLHETPIFTDFGVPMVRVTDIKRGDLSVENAKTVSEENYLKFIKKYEPKLGDIVMSRVGSYGVSSYVANDKPFCMGQNTVIINPTGISGRFLYECLESNCIQRQIELEVAGSGYKSLSLADIRALIIPVPPKREQENIKDLLLSIDGKVTAQKQKLSKTQSLKKSLMQDLLTGKVRVQVN